MKASWGYLQLTCGNCGHSLTIEGGPWGAFYQCEQPTCFNRFTTNIYEKLLEKVYQVVMKKTNVVHQTFQIRSGKLLVQAEIVRQTPQQVTLSVLNCSKRSSISTLVV